MMQDMKKDMKLQSIAKRLVRNGRTCVRQGAYCSSFMGVLRLFVLLFLLTVGVRNAWGQDSPSGPDRSGYYYIINYTLVGNKTHYNASEPQNGYYLCPAAPPADADANYNYDAVYYDGGSKQKPYLTTFKTGRVNDAVWKIEFAGTDENDVDYYYLKHCSSNKYLTHNNPIIASDRHRLSVHLQTEKDGNYSMFCFETGFDDESSFFIRPRQVSSGNRHLNPTHQNCNYYYGTTDGNKKTTINNKTINLGGMVGYYSKADHSDDKASQWYLEKLPPVISYNSSNLIEISYMDASYTIYYTTDGNEPPTSGDEHKYSVAFDPPAGTTTIKAIAIKDGKESGVATFTPIFLLGSTHKYLIQNQNNGWDTGNFQGNHFYMIPGDVDNGKTKVNTTSMLRPSMQWYILNAGDNYYYIVNNVDDTRMRYNTTNGVHMDTWDNSNADEFKFQIVASSTAGTYNIIPYGVTADNKYLNKASGNTSENALILNNSATDANSRWKFVPQDTPLADTPPFTPSGAGTSVYYKIQNGNGTTYHLTPPAKADGNATASNASDDATVKSMSWYFTQVEASTTTDWLSYYKIINAVTGKALYYANTANNSPCLKVGDYNGNNDDYKFAFVKSPTADYYYIVPKSNKDDQLNKISTFYREGSNIKPATTRAASSNVWKFIPADLFCNDPEFVEEGGVITIKCNTNVAKIYINTESDANPTDGSTLYDPTQVSWTTNDQVRVKAIAIVSDGTNTVSSAVITLLNKPDVTLAGGPYGYKAAAWEPSVTVSIGEDGNATTAASGTYTTAYANNINAGTANITITDADDTDDLYIWNVPVTEFTIDRVPLTIKAEDKSIGYGDEPDNAGVTYVGFVGNPVETATVLGGTLSYSYTTSGDDPHPYTPYDAQYGNQGTYVITPSGLTSTNYEITFSTGVLTVAKKSIGDGALAEGFTLSFDEDGNVILNFGTHTLNKDVDYTIGDEVSGTKYSSKTISGTGNYTGYLSIRNAIVHFTSDDNQVEWSATFVAESSGENDIGHALPDDISAYLISGIEGTWAIPEPLDYIPAGVPVLLVAHEEKNGFLVSDANSESVNEITNLQKGYNLLKEVTEESAYFNTKQIYVLYKNEFVLNKEGNLGQGKVYMENPNYSTSSPSPAPARLTIIWGNETNIEDIQTNGAMEVGNVRWYTIDGRRLSGKPSAKGLYIVNGKKRVVK